ncbi:uncharacterized protein METZ01_LOCUS404323, partial [marine metagenome]
VESFHELEVDIIFLIGAPIWTGLSFFDEYAVIQIELMLT